MAQPHVTPSKLESMRTEYSALRARKRWSEADHVAIRSIDLALSQEQTRGPAVAGFVYVAGGPRPNMAPCRNQDRSQLPDERLFAMRAMLRA